MEERLDKIETEIQELRKDIHNLTLICSKMDNHITFVEKVYSSVFTPANYIIKRVESFMGIEKERQNTLPTLPDEKYMIQDKTGQRSDNGSI